MQTPLTRLQGSAIEPHLATRFAGKDIGDAEESEKPLVFWLKTLADEAPRP